MLGDTCTGKTSLVLRFAEGYYRDESRSATVGAFFITKRLQVNGITCKIQIWDTAGQAQFRPMAPMYYKNAAAAIVTYDVTSPQSFKVMRYWLDELHQNTSAGSIVIAIAATKVDLSKDALVPTSEGEEMANAMGAIFVDTSAKANTNVTTLFRRVAERVLQFRERAKRDGTDVNEIPVTPGASIDERGHVVKKGMRNGNSSHSSPMLVRPAGDAQSQQRSRGSSKGDRRRDKRTKSGNVDKTKLYDQSSYSNGAEISLTESVDLVDAKGKGNNLICGESSMLGCGILPDNKGKNGDEAGCVIL